MSREQNPGETRLQRIERYERIYQRIQEATAGLEKAFAAWADLRPEMEELEKYYTGERWKQDFAADEAGELPKDLKRGVLSEDGIYNLITDQARWMRLLPEGEDGP